MMYTRRPSLTLMTDASTMRHYPLSRRVKLQPYPSDPGLEGALSEEVEEVEATEDVTEVMDSLRSVEDMM